MDSALASEGVHAQLAESLPLIGVDRVHQELRINGLRVGILIMDDWTINENGYAHGQAVADIVRAVAPGARIWSCKLIFFAQISQRDFADCLLRIVRERLPVRVVNMSFAVGEEVFDRPCDSLDDPLTRAIRLLRQKGVVFVAAAGNDGRKNALRYPACLPEVISVGATYDLAGAVQFDNDQVFCRDMAVIDNVTCYSNVAEFLDLVAPGTTISTPTASNFGGTSAAAPIVTGVIALMLGADPSLPQRAILEHLRTTAVLVRDPRSSQSFPRVEAYRAVRAVLAARQTPSATASSPAIANFDTNGDGVIDDSEYYTALEAWIAGEISDELFFNVTDYWVRGLRVRATEAKFSFENTQKIQLFDLQGREIAQLEGASSGELRALVRTLANGVYVYVATRTVQGKTVRYMGKIVVLR